MRHLRPVDAAPVQVLDALEQGQHGAGQRGPVHGERVVGPVQDAGLVQVCEEQLAGHPVVVAQPGAGERKADPPIEQQHNLQQPRLVHPGRLQLHGRPERGEVAAQLLEAVEPERHPLLDHEGVEGQVAVAVGAIVDEVPQHEGLLHQRLVAEHRLGLRRQRQARGGDGGAGDGPEARGLAVAEDTAPGEQRRLAHRHRLGEQHRGVRVVAGGEVEEGQRHELCVAVAGGLDRCHPRRPHHLQQHGLELALGGAVLGEHREQHQVAHTVHAGELGPEQQQRVEEVRHPEPGGPPTQIGPHRLEVGGIVREQRGELGDGGDQLLDRDRGVRVLVGHRAVRGLQRLQPVRRLFQCRPRRVSAGLLAGGGDDVRDVGHGDLVRLGRGGGTTRARGSGGCARTQGPARASRQATVALSPAGPLLAGAGHPGQLRSVSRGCVASSASGIGWRRSTRPHRSTRPGSSTSVGNEASTSQSPRASSPSSCPPDQPA